MKIYNKFATQHFQIVIHIAGKLNIKLLNIFSQIHTIGL